MNKFLVVIQSVLVLSLMLTCQDIYSLSPAQYGKVANPRVHPREHPRNSVSSNKTFRGAIQKVSPQQVNSSNQYQHQLDGDWEYVIGQFGFYHDFPGLGRSFISIIGVKAEPNGNGIYTTAEWDRNAFWFDVGDGIPMHLSAEYYDEYTDPDDENNVIFIYSALNLLYRQNGKDYSQTEYDGEWIELELETDINHNVIDYNILILDENEEEVIDIRKFEPGDQVESWTSTFDLNDPEYIWLTSMEEDFRVVQGAPVFTYEHMTPNVDFPNEITKDLIDFETIDLQLTLFGESEDGDTDTPFIFSPVKDISIKWNGSTSTSVIDWVYHLFE